MTYSWRQGQQESEPERKYRALEDRTEQIQNELMSMLRADTVEQQLFHINRAQADIEDVRDMIYNSTRRSGVPY